MDNSRAEAVANASRSAANAYKELGKPLPFDAVVINPTSRTSELRTLRIFIVVDAAKGRVAPGGCAIAPPAKDEPLDDMSVRGGCVVSGLDQLEIRCSGEAVRLLGDVNGHQGRANPALLYVLAHEFGHVYQRGIGEYSGRLESIDLKADRATKLALLKDGCDPNATKREEEADALAVQVLARRLPASPYREPLFSERGSLYWNVDQLYLAANSWEQSVLEREFISQPKPHASFVPTELPATKRVIEAKAKRFVCDVLTRKRGIVRYPAQSAAHPPLDQRMRKVAEALKPVAESLPNSGAKQEFQSIAVLQEQVSPIFNFIYRETGVYLEDIQASICTRVNGDRPAAAC